MNVIRARRFALSAAAALLLWLGSGARAEAQLGALVSPGRLAAAHASLEGLSNCSKCHEQGRKVTARKCLACHAPIAQRIAGNVGVHRNTGGGCVTCHADHAGTEGELRPFDQKGFDHTANTSFPLDGKHEPLAARCSACHKTRSFVTAPTACASCHADVHKGSLGNACQTCHSTRAAFKGSGAQFDHTKAAFQLVGAHKAVTCASCHANGVFKGVKFASCSGCHNDQHRPSFGATCTSCHTNDSWRTTTVNHARTAFPLIGKHARVDCAACHTQPTMKAKPKADTCAACHVDVHRGTFKQDCHACHSESGFEGAPFDHAQTQFLLTAGHDGLPCVRCHTATLPALRPVVAARSAAPARPSTSTTVDFRELKTACASCHSDVHHGELGTSCDTCHSTASFKIPGYTHQRPQPFFAEQHAPVACEKCHVPAPLTAPIRSGAPVFSVVFKNAPMACAGCHKDVHIGQLGPECQTCHTIQRVKFGVPGFSHTTTRFALPGRHESLACAQCHKYESGVFPAGSGTAVRYKGLGTECRACHADVHLGQLSDRCETCHGNVTFKLSGYTHTARSLSGFFTGKHAKASCADCHKPGTGTFPSATGTAIRFSMNAACVTCHTDIHRGALGPACATCHRP